MRSDLLLKQPIDLIGAFSMFTQDMYISLTPRWAIFLMGMVAAVLGVVPFVAYYRGPEIRSRSKYSKILMAEERKRVVDAEREDKERNLEEAAEAGYTAGEGQIASSEKGRPQDEDRGQGMGRRYG